MLLPAPALAGAASRPARSPPRWPTPTRPAPRPAALPLRARISRPPPTKRASDRRLCAVSIERPAIRAPGRAAGSAQVPALSSEQVSRPYFTAQVRAVSRRSRTTDGVDGFACQLCARPVDYNCKQRPERDVIGELRHERQGVDCWEPAADQANVDDPDREPGCCTPSNRPASRQRSGQHFPARSGDADVDDGAANEPTAPWRK